jgi:predicted permease
MKLLRRIDYWMNRRKRDAELAEELDFHRAQGDPAHQLGNTTLAREDARAVWIWPWLESIAQDLRYALRNLRRNPGFTLIALLTLGLTIGLNTSLFTVFNAVVFRMWPVKDPARMVKILATQQFSKRPRGFSLAEYRYMSEHTRSFAGIIGLHIERVRLGFEGFGKASSGAFVSANYFQLLGVPMERGRGFLPEEDILDAPANVIVLSYALWRDHFGSDSTIVGKQIHVDDVSFTVVGVAAEEFSGALNPGGEELWMTLAAMQSLHPNDPSIREFLRSPNDCCSDVAGRLAPGVSQPQAQAELTVLSRQFHQENKLDAVNVVFADATLLAGHAKRKSILPVFALMFAGVTMVLLLACANVGNLLIARAAARQREIQVRRSLGAGRARIIRQLLTEGFVLALAASLLGIALAWKLPGFVFEQIGDSPNIRLTPDLTVIAYAIALAAFSCVGFALAPALHGTRQKATRSRLPLRSVLLAAQVAISVVLLICAGLMFTGVQHARTHDLGYRVQDVAVISFELPASSYDAKRTHEFYSQLIGDLSAAGETGRFGVTAREPLAHSHWNTSFRLPGEAEKTAHDIEFQEVSAGYFDVLGIPIVAGRNFQPADAARHAVVINETMARRYFDGENPIGKSVITGKDSREIVGVARDALLTGLDRFVPLFFQPFTGIQIPQLLVRKDFAGAVDLASGIGKRIDARARVQSAPLSDNLDRLLAASRVMAGIAGALGVFALVLAVIGMSGVFAYVVQQRTKEIGIRMALGAEPKQVIALVLAGTARAAIIGLAIGYVAATGCAKLLADYLYGASPYDPRAYFEVAAILAISALAAAYLPARRATRVDPLDALRVE